MGYGKNWKNSGGFFDLSQKTETIKSIQDKMAQADFWNDVAAANKLLADLKYCKSCVDPYEKNVKKLNDLKE